MDGAVAEGADDEVLGGRVVGKTFWVEIWGSEIDEVRLGGLSLDQQNGGEDKEDGGNKGRRLRCD